MKPPHPLYNPVLFKNRSEAGQKLAQKLKKLALKNPVVFAIPNGGVPVGVKIAQSLKCPLELVIVRKIQFPWTTEAGFGAISPDGTLYLNPHAEELDPQTIKTQAQKTLQQIRKREKELLPVKKRSLNLKDKTVILVDDGLATGITMMAAIGFLQKKQPARIIIAVPTASDEALKLLKNQVQKLITLYQHPQNWPFAVACSYEEWHDLTAQEVKRYLRLTKK